MSRAYMEIKDPLKEHPFAPVDLPPTAQWWRLSLLSSRALPDGNLLLMQIDDLESPGVMTYTFNDGEDEDVYPVAVRQSTDTGNCSITHLVMDVSYHLDVLMVGRPTASAWWRELTQPGRHWHPDYGKIPHDEWSAEVIRQSVLIREGIL